MYKVGLGLRDCIALKLKLSWVVKHIQFSVQSPTEEINSSGPFIIIIGLGKLINKIPVLVTYRNFFLNVGLKLKVALTLEIVGHRSNQSSEHFPFPASLEIENKISGKPKLPSSNQPGKNRSWSQPTLNSQCHCVTDHRCIVFESRVSQRYQVSMRQSSQSAAHSYRQSRDEDSRQQNIHASHFQLRTDQNIEY